MKSNFGLPLLAATTTVLADNSFQATHSGREFESLTSLNLADVSLRLRDDRVGSDFSAQYLQNTTFGNLSYSLGAGDLAHEHIDYQRGMLKLSQKDNFVALSINAVEGSGAQYVGSLNYNFSAFKIQASVDNTSNWRMRLLTMSSSDSFSIAIGVQDDHPVWNTSYNNKHFIVQYTDAVNKPAQVIAVIGDIPLKRTEFTHSVLGPGVNNIDRLRQREFDLSLGEFDLLNAAPGAMLGEKLGSVNGDFRWQEAFADKGDKFQVAASVRLGDIGIFKENALTVSTTMQDRHSTGALEIYTKIKNATLRFKLILEEEKVRAAAFIGVKF